MPTKWEVSGTYFETCNCDAACPCVFLSPPTTGDCTVLIGWHIDQGQFGETPLQGLNVVMVVHSPGNMVEVKWQVALYLDERADEQQRDALTRIFSGQAGGHPAVLAGHVGEILGVKSVGIDYLAEGKRRRLRIPDIAEAEIEGLSGQNEAAVTINNHPLAISPGFPATVARSQRLAYADHGVSLEISGKNGFYSPFTYRG